VVLQWCLFYFFILYTKFLPEGVLQFQHIVYSILSLSKLDQDGTFNFREVIFDFLNSYLIPLENPQTDYKKPLKIGF